MPRLSSLAPNFYDYEVGRSMTATRLGIDNTPTRGVLDNAAALAINILQPIRDHFQTPFSPQSWYRCEELERVLTWNTGFKRFQARHSDGSGDGTAASWSSYFALKSHPRGEAADIEIPGVSNLVLFEWCKRNLPRYDQLILEFHKPTDPRSGWVHVSYSRMANRREAFTVGG